MGRLFDDFPLPVVHNKPTIEELKASILGDFVTRTREAGNEYKVERTETDSMVIAAETGAVVTAKLIRYLNHTARVANCVQFAFGDDLDTYWLKPAGMNRLEGESDEAAQARYILEESAKSYGTHDDSYRARARSVSSSIVAVGVDTRVIDYSNREVVLFILTNTEDGKADQDLLDRINAHMNEQELKGEGVTRVVAENSTTHIANPHYVIEHYEDALLPPDEILMEKIKSQFAKDRKLGFALTDSYLAAPLQISGVRKVRLSNWQDVIPSRNEAVAIGNITIDREQVND